MVSEDIADVSIPVVDALTLYFLCQQALRTVVDKSVYNAVTAKVAYQEMNKAHQLLGCGCGLTATIPATLMSPLYYIGDVIGAGMVCAYLPMGARLLAPLLMLREGQALLEYHLGASGHCQVHLLERLNSNNAFAFGYGASFYATSGLVNFILRSLSGQENFLLEKAIESLLYQYFIFMVYQLDRPLPGKKIGIDFFRYSRLVTQAMVKEAGGWLEKQLMNQKAGEEWVRIKKNVSEFPPFKLLVRLFLVDQLKSIEQYVDSRAGQLYLDYYGENLRNTITWILNLRNQEVVMRINSVSGFLPGFILSESTKKILAVLLNEKIETILRVIQDFLDKVDLSAPAKVKVLSHPQNPDQPLVLTSVIDEHYDPLPPNAPPAVKKKHDVEALLRKRQPEVPRPAPRIGLFDVPNTFPNLTSSEPGSLRRNANAKPPF